MLPVFTRSTDRVVTIRFQPEALLDEEVEEFKAGLSKALLQRPCAALFDTRDSPPPSAHVRSHMGEFIKDNFAAIERYVAGSAYVFSSPLFQGVLTAVLWITPHPGPYRICRDVEEAERWAKRKVLGENTESFLIAD